jgi:hypothetical protein
MKLIKKYSLDDHEIIHIRGYTREVEDINFVDLGDQQEAYSKDTGMWNPLHFAIYNGHNEIVKLLYEEMGINISKTGPRSLAQNEGE